MGRWFGEAPAFQIVHHERLTHLLVVATGRPLVRELAAIPDDEMSSFDALCEVCPSSLILASEC
jgi:hypothetical protein